MSIPKAEFAAWFDWARARFIERISYPLIDTKVYNFDLLCDAYSETTDNPATREHLEARLAHAPNDRSTRFVILNYYYELSRFHPDFKEELIGHLRLQFHRDLAFFVGLRPVEECTSVEDICWEITNACAIRDWTRAQALYLRLRSTGEIARSAFHAAYGNFLFRAAFGDYDPEDPDDDSETLPHWSLTILDQRPKSDLDNLTFDISGLALGLATGFSLPTGRSEELVRDAKNELEKARDALSELRPGLRSALGRCYMARGDFRQAAYEYRALGNMLLDGMAWMGIQATELRSAAWARAAAALELAQDDFELRQFLETWINSSPRELGPREHLARFEARCGNYEAAFRYLSEENSMNPARDQDWKSTLLVELGTRAGSEERVAELVRRNIERNPELRAIMEGIIGDYWPTFRLLTPPARESFAIATRLLFDSNIGESAWMHAAMAAGKSVELQLRAAVFEPFADFARRITSPPARSNARPEPLVAFIERRTAGPLTLGAMVKYLLSMVNPREGIERTLLDWLEIYRPNLCIALTQRKLNAALDIGGLRNRATHASISQEEAANLYRGSRSWLDELTRDE